MIIKKEKNIHNISKFILILWCFFITLYYFIPIISLWESAEIYKTFLPTKKPLFILGINEDPVLFSPNSFYGYPAIVISKYINEFLGSGIFNLRLLSLVYGLISLFFFYIITLRSFEKRTALLSTFFLASSSYFIIYQHLLLSPIVTLMSILICLERYQNLIIKKNQVAILTFALACVFACLHYWTARWSMLIILFFYLIDTNKIFPLTVKKIFNIFKRNRIIDFLKVILLISFILFIIYPGNIFLLYDLNFLIPENRAGEYTSDINNLFKNIYLNSIYFLKFYIFNFNHSAYDILFHIPYNIENKIILLLLIVGLYGIFKNKPSNNSVLLITLLLLNLFAPLTSETFPTNNLEGSTTLSPHRLFFIVPFICLFSGYGFFYVFDILKKFINKKNLKYFLVFSLFIIIIFRITSHHLEFKKFTNGVNNYNVNITKPIQVPEKQKSSNYFKLYKESIYNQIYFLKLSKFISKKIKNSDLSKSNKKKAIYIPENKYTPNKVVIGGLVPKKGDNYYFQIFLSLYLKNENINNFYLVKKDNIDEKLINKLIKVLKRYKEGKNKQGEFPRNNNHEIILKTIDKIILIMFGENFYENFLMKSSIEFTSSDFKEYFYYPNKTNSKSLLLITNEKELKLVKDSNKYEIIFP